MPINTIQIISNEVARVESFAEANPLHHRNDPEQINAIIELALRFPDWGPPQISDFYKRKRTIPIKFSIANFLMRNHLLKSDGRQQCLEAIEKLRPNLDRLLWANEIDPARLAYEKILSLREANRKSWPVVARVVILGIAEQLRERRMEPYVSVGNRIISVTGKILLPSSNGLLRGVIDRSAEAWGFKQTSTVGDQLAEIIETVDEYQPIGTDDNVVQDISSFEAENADLRATLFGLKQELIELQTRISNLQETARTNAVIMLMAEINSPAKGYLLDNMVRSNLVTNQLLREGWQPEPVEVEGVVYSLKMLMEYLSQLGITPIRKIGERAKISIDDLATLSYAGSEFKNHHELKWVEFRSTGWMYKGNIISKPQVIEISGPS